MKLFKAKSLNGNRDTLIAGERPAEMSVNISKPLSFNITTSLFLLIFGLVFSFTVYGSVIPISGPSPYAVGGDGDPSNPLNIVECANYGVDPVGRVHRNSEVEPTLSVSSNDPNIVVVAWQQDRWSNGGGQGIGVSYSDDGGSTWNFVNVPFTRCSGGNAANNGDYSRASDPWLTYSPATPDTPMGTFHLMVLSFEAFDGIGPDDRSAQVVTRSTDGGVTWSIPITIGITNGQGSARFNDKNTITADPYDPSKVYAVWQGVHGTANPNSGDFAGEGSVTLFARSTSGGASYETVKKIFTPIQFFAPETPETIVNLGHQIVVLPDIPGTTINEEGTLVNVFIAGAQSVSGDVFDIAFLVQRSTDGGKHWREEPIRIDSLFPVGGYIPWQAIDPERMILVDGEPRFLGVRDAGFVHDVAVNRSNGKIYVVWQDASFNLFGFGFPGVGIVISMSADGGLTWSDPQPVFPSAPLPLQAFLPTVHVADNGKVGVMYYDFRNDIPGGGLDTDVHLAVFDENLIAKHCEATLTDQSFNMRNAVKTPGLATTSPGIKLTIGVDVQAVYFPGDYMGLDSNGNQFYAAFTIMNDGPFPNDLPDQNILSSENFNRSDIVFKKIDTDCN